MMGLIKLFWYLIHVEQMVRNSNSITTDMIVDILENIRMTIVSAVFSKIWHAFWGFLTLQDKHKGSLLYLILKFVHCIFLCTKFLEEQIIIDFDFT
jgi:hypothetical protein